jgi:hypothetical protein
MTPTDPQSDDSPELEVPQGLRDDLARFYRADLSVPAGVDEAIRVAARRHFLLRRRSRRIIRLVQISAAAAVILLAVRVANHREQVPSGSMALTPPAVKEDIDGNGRVNILDAFALARHVETDGSPNPAWDINGDGAVDGSDIDAVAMAAVRLDQGAS